MKIKFKGLKNLPKIVLSAFITSLLVSILLISLPYTEKIYDSARYDITLAPEKWKKEYTLELTIKTDDNQKKGRKVAETKAIIEKRLRKYGVQNIQFSDIKSDARDKAYIKITVETDKEKDFVETLISQRYYLRFVIRKDGVNFDDENNIIAQYDRTNYLNTPYTLHDFRQVYITELKTSSGEMAYFSIYKPWEHKAGQFYSYFDRYAGEYAGISIDGFVSPILIPITASGQTSGIISRNPFAIGLGGGSEDAEVIDILANSGVIPVEYTQTEVRDLQSSSFTVDYLRAIVLFAILTVTIFIINYLVTKQGNLKDLITYGLTGAAFITFAKLTQLPLQPLTLIYSNIALIILMPIFITSKQVTIVLIVLSALLYYTGMGYIRDIAFVLGIVLTLYYILSLIITYLNSLIKELINND